MTPRSASRCHDRSGSAFSVSNNGCTLGLRLPARAPCRSLSLRRRPWCTDGQPVHRLRRSRLPHHRRPPRARAWRHLRLRCGDAPLWDPDHRDHERPLTATVTNTGTANLVITAGATELLLRSGLHGRHQRLRQRCRRRASCTPSRSKAHRRPSGHGRPPLHRAQCRHGPQRHADGHGPGPGRHGSDARDSGNKVAFGARRLNTNTTQTLRLTNNGPGVIDPISGARSPSPWATARRRSQPVGPPEGPLGDVQAHGGGIGDHELDGHQRRGR